MEAQRPRSLLEKLAMPAGFMQITILRYAATVVKGYLLRLVT